MTALLYYSYSRKLSEDELVEIDKEVDINRKLVYVFIRKLPLNAKRKAKIIYLYMIFTFTVMLPLPPTEIHSLSSIDESRITCPQIAAVIQSKVDKVRLTNQQ